MSSLLIGSQSNPPKALIEDVAELVHARFADTKSGKFGITRLGEPYDTHRYQPLTPETKAEKRVIQDLESGGWETVIYTSRPGDGSRAKGKSSHFGRKLNGPVKVYTKGLWKTNLPSAGTVIPNEFAAIADATVAGKKGPFSYKGWRFYPNAVKADRTCISCHVNGKGEQVRVGDTIGYFLIGMRKKSNQP